MFIGGRKAVERLGAVGTVKAVGAVEAVNGIAWREVGWFVMVEGGGSSRRHCVGWLVVMEGKICDT